MKKYLADTHILLWALENNMDNTKMPLRAKEIMLDENCEIFYSFVNVWEVALRRVNHTERIPYTAEEFDRLLLAQAKYENMMFLTHDHLIPFYNEDCVVKV